MLVTLVGVIVRLPMTFIGLGDAPGCSVPALVSVLPPRLMVALPLIKPLAAFVKLLPDVTSVPAPSAMVPTLTRLPALLIVIVLAPGAVMPFRLSVDAVLV